MSEEEVLTRVDRFVCDIKESQFGEGLHIYGRCTNKQMDLTCAENERTGIVSALSGLRVEAGPAGSPYRGRTDVLPTGRNLFASDPLSLPTKAAYSQGKILADELIRRNLQDNGDWPQGLLVDLWGSATMRTAGEEFAMALALMGVKPLWREGSERVFGIEIVPIAELDRPRIDVTLRISGLFRDVFPTLSQLFNQAVGLLENREESIDWNPYVRHKNTTTARVYGFQSIDSSRFSRSPTA
jgi:cobaltochelatase CobN